MTGNGHRLSGVALAPAIYFKSFVMFGNHLASVIACLFLLSGSTAPDWLEIRKKSGGTIINHRTYTHWVPLWVGLLFLSLYMKDNKTLEIMDYTINNNIYLTSLLFGFSVGGLLHLVVDFPNKMGIPFLSPVKRIGLGLWKSGEKETFIVVSIFIFSVLYVLDGTGILEINYQSIMRYFRDLFFNLKDIFW